TQNVTLLKLSVGSLCKSSITITRYARVHANSCARCHCPSPFTNAPPPLPLTLAKDSCRLSRAALAFPKPRRLAPAAKARVRGARRDSVVNLHRTVLSPHPLVIPVTPRFELRFGSKPCDNPPILEIATAIRCPQQPRECVLP